MDELLDTAPLRDQRTMIGVTHASLAHSSIEEVEQAWRDWADTHGLVVRRRAGDYTTELQKSRKTIVVHISAGKWIGDCPDCNGGIAGWPFHRHGACLDCGTIFQLEYPTAAEVVELVELMRARPEAQRNWFPHRGETIEDARRENAVNQFADQPASGLVSLATLKDVLSKRAFAELEKAGLV